MRGDFEAASESPCPMPMSSLPPQPDASVDFKESGLWVRV